MFLLNMFFLRYTSSNTKQPSWAPGFGAKVPSAATRKLRDLNVTWRKSQGGFQGGQKQRHQKLVGGLEQKATPLKWCFGPVRFRSFFDVSLCFLLQSLDDIRIHFAFTCYLGSLGPAGRPTFVAGIASWETPAVWSLIHERESTLFAWSSSEPESANPWDVSSPRHLGSFAALFLEKPPKNWIWVCLKIVYP